MKNLIKYEARKALFSKFVILVAVGIFEIVFLIGLFFTNYKENATMAIGCSGLAVSAIIAIAYMGIESLFTLYRDLNTKQSYMLFMTPNSSYKILGAKIIENAISIVTSGAFFSILALADLSILFTKEGSIKPLIELLNSIFSINIDLQDIAITIIYVFFSVLGAWILMISEGYLAITLSASVFAGKKYNGIISFILYVVLSIIFNNVLVKVSGTTSGFVDLRFMPFLCIFIVSLILSAIMYYISSYIMEKKLSV